MTDPIKTQLKSFAAKEETAAKAWLGSNWVPVTVGAASVVIVEAILYFLKLI